MVGGGQAELMSTIVENDMVGEAIADLKRWSKEYLVDSAETTTALNQLIKGV